MFMRTVVTLSMPPHRFTWNTYCGRVGFAITQIMPHLDGKLRAGVAILGICDAKLIPVRPRPGEWAIMIEMPADEFEGDLMCWFHADAQILSNLGIEVLE